jgi:hypothetical protein
MAAVLTPGLTPRQRERLSSALQRIGGAPVGVIASLFMDVDRAAVRALDPRGPIPGPSCTDVTSAIATAHRLPIEVIACCYGIAVGVRLGRTFIVPPSPRRKWISEEYARLTEHNRRDVQRYIRRLLKAQAPPTPRSSDPHAELSAARKWIRTAGALARAGR